MGDRIGAIDCSVSGPEDEPLLKLEQEILDIEKEIEDLKGVRVQFQEELKVLED